METHENQAQEKLQDGDFQSGFVWQDYLDATNSVEVPQIMFPHVEQTLQNSIEIGMSLEVPVRKNNEGESSYWVACIVMACGPLLRLRYFGGDDRSLEFWFNLTKEAGHELGWSMKNGKKLEPPDVILERSPDCIDKLHEFLATARSLPAEMLTGDGLSMTERIKQNMKVEISDVLHPYKLWVATIVENVGGRLLLRYDTPGSFRENFWIFCTSERLHSYGSASKSNSTWFLEPPSSIVDLHTYEEWKDLLESKSKDCQLPEEIFNNNNREHPKHDFNVGMKVEALNPVDRTKIQPATVSKVFDDAYFLVTIDAYTQQYGSYGSDCTPISNNTEKNTWLCTAEHPYIFPIGWAQKQNIVITPPQGWTSKTGDFNWNEYLEAFATAAAPENLFSERASAAEAGFECGMRLEAVDPEHKHVICAARITKIIDNLLWIKLDNYEYCRPDHIVDMHSLQIFPVGWCESNHYPLKPPHDYFEICKKLEMSEKEEKKANVLDIPISEPRSSLWCPKIYFNYRCFTGPMISKGKLATLPKSVGPGPVILVMREVLSMIVSVGYRSARILKVLQCDTKPDPGFHLEVLKAKHKNNTYRASVAIVTSGDMVADFCRSICKKLMVCPNLFGPLHVSESECPDECYKTSKTKYIASVGTGKRGKPKGYTSIMVQKTKPWGRRRRRRRGRWANKHKAIVHEEYDQEDEMPFMSLDLVKHVAENIEDAYDDGRQPLSEIDIMIQKGLEKSDKSDDFKTEIPSSNISEDSGSSFNDRKAKDREMCISPNVLNSKQHSTRFSSQSGRGTKRDWDTSIESDGSDMEAEYVKIQKTQRRPKTRKLDSNPLYWSVDDVFRYLRKTNDCKDLAYRVKEEEIDGLAFLLLNLPSLTQHMKLRTSLAMKLCRHVEQVKVTFFLRHIHEVEPEQYHFV